MDLQAFLSSSIGLAMVLGLVTVVYFYRKHRNVPPGPTGLPLLGYAPFFGPNPQDTFLKLGKKYGNIFSIYLGPQLNIVLNSYEAIKAAYIGQADNFSGRADGFVFRTLSTGKDGKIHGIIMTEGKEWKITRRFMLQSFRDLGMGKSRIQERIVEETEHLCNEMANFVGKAAFDPSENFLKAASNVICILCFGQRFEYSDSQFLQRLNELIRTSECLAQAGPLQSYPILRFIPGPLRNMWIDINSIANKNHQFNYAMIDEHRKTVDANETRDYIDAFLHHQQKTDTSSTQIGFQDEDLSTNLSAFFGAGTDTTSSSLYWSILFMISHPDVQEKVHQEIDKNIGSKRSITMDDRSQLVYLQAVCNEIQRLANVTPFGVLRSNIEETTLMGYRIPKRSFITPNFAAVNLDPKLWPDPQAFKPERFLDEKGKLVEPPYFMPFSIGKRACVGESLARMEIFLFFANIMQRFQVEADKDFPAPATNQYITGISCRPLPFNIKIHSR